MKRSEINNLIREAKTFFEVMKFHLPPWAYWSFSTWKNEKDNAREVIRKMLGWDITDFGSGDFHHRGLLLFTLRNGGKGKNERPYAEKVMVVEEKQETPMHFHRKKTEDIINRGGGNLVIELFNSDANDNLSFSDVKIRMDGLERRVPAGKTVILTPGESICLTPGIYHRFYGEELKGKVLVGEVSSVNDDKQDNHFFEKAGRFPEIEEDIKPTHLLVSDYKKFLL